MKSLILGTDPRFIHVPDTVVFVVRMPRALPSSDCVASALPLVKIEDCLPVSPLLYYAHRHA